MQLDLERRRVDSEKIQIKERVDVCTKKQPIRGMVILLSLVGSDMRSLQQIGESAPSDEAGISESQPERLAECGLASPGADLAPGDFALIMP